MKSLHYFLSAAGIAAIMATSCNDLSNIEKDLDSLESRVTALETQVKALNENITALQQLRDATTIQEATHDEANNVWTVVLSNGTTLTLNDGTIGTGNTPVLSIDDEGYWTVDYGDGNGFIQVLRGGQPVKAVGTDGKTPVFGVDSEGYWTVDYGDGPARVNDSAGNPVKATSSEAVSDPFFSNIEYDKADNLFIVTLKDGSTISLPVISGFYFHILNGEGAQVFDYNDTKIYNVEMAGVVATTVVAKPEGWTVVFDDSALSLTVTAPAVATKAAGADSRTDVAILAVSEKGFSAIAKLTVSLNDEPIELHPAASVTFVNATETTLTFSVATSDASGYKYIVAESGTAVSADEIFQNGTDGTGDTFTAEGLTEETAYTAHVLPYNGDILGEVATVDGKTIAGPITDYYTAWEAGKDIVIAGITYNKTTYGEATLLSSTVETTTDLRAQIHQKSGVFFLDNEDGAYFDMPSIAEILDNIVLIGRYPDKKATIIPAKNMKLISGSLTMFNLYFDLIKINGDPNATYLCNNANSTDDFNWYIDNCDFRNVMKPMLYSSIATYTFKHLIVMNSSFGLSGTATLQLFNLYKCSVLDRCQELRFDNNIVYNKDNGDISVFQWDQTIAQSGTDWNTIISMCNNSFYNSPSKNSYIKFYQPASLSICRNIFHSSQENTNSAYIYLINSPNWSYENVEITDNIAFGLTKNWTIGHSSSGDNHPTPNTITNEADSPYAYVDLENGILTPKAEFINLGAQR